MNEKQRPTIETERLILRSFILEDATELELISQDGDISATTSGSEVPKPNMADQWISIRIERFERGDSIDFAIIHKTKRSLLGTIGLGFEYKNDESMQLGFWLGRTYWNQGYCTEAAQAVLGYGFKSFGLHRIFSRHFSSNPASGHVLQKIGMRYEGTLREAFKKSGRFENVECYGILRDEYLS